MVFFDFDFEFVFGGARFKDVGLGNLKIGGGRLGYNILLIYNEP